MLTTKPSRAVRYHDISAGHRVVGHESKCRYLHGHNYRVHFTCEGALDSIGRVIDFGVMKIKLCEWLEQHWDHRFLAWEQDPIVRAMLTASPLADSFDFDNMHDSIVWLPFNPTAENMALYLLRDVGPSQLFGTGVRLVHVRVDETRKCSAEVSL